MKVSVCMISYNQEQYIAQAIEGVLNQCTTFDYELLISDDCSSDGTRDIIENFKLRFPNKIRAIYRESNLGMMPNFISALQACIGEYIAICEGDDYWIDEGKLQKQVSFLDANQNFAICFTRVYELRGKSMQIVSNNPWEEEKTFSIIDLAKQNFINALSVVFRNNLISYYPDWFYSSAIGDYVIHMLNSRKGLIKYFPELTGVYRMYTGVWSTKSLETQLGKLIDVLGFLVKEDFEPEVLVELINQRENLMIYYSTILLNRNDFSFIDKFSSELLAESKFVKSMLMDVYPNKIKGFYSSKNHRFFSFLSKAKKFIINK